VRVLLHHRSASGRVHCDELGSRSLERGDVSSSEAASGIEISRVCVQCTATFLTTRLDNRVTIPLENARGRAVRLRE
jgi:hypothetical protein